MEGEQVCPLPTAAGCAFHRRFSVRLSINLHTVDTVHAGGAYSTMIKNGVPGTRRIAGNSSEPHRQSSVIHHGDQGWSGTPDPASVHQAQHPNLGTTAIRRFQSGKKTEKYDCNKRRQSRDEFVYIDVQLMQKGEVSYDMR